MILFFNSIIFPSLGVAILERIEKPDVELNKDKFEIEHKALQTSLQNIEQRLEKKKSYLTGENITIADIQAACEIM